MARSSPPEVAPSVAEETREVVRAVHEGQAAAPIAGLQRRPSQETSRVRADGNHLSAGGKVLRVRGVTYGSFRPRADGEPFPETSQVAADFEVMAANGLNVVRTYALPPQDLFDLASEFGLLLLVGLHYRDWREATTHGRMVNRRVLDAGRRAVAAAMQRCSDNPNVLAVSVGNEVPTDLIRLHGVGAVEDALSHLVAEVHAADAEMLATYVSFPTTEYLRVAGLDAVCFNVFLERETALRRYLRHLQIVSGDKPLLVTELGLASGVHGLQAQAVSLRWQLRVVEESGCAGATVFSWTDEWAIGDRPVEGWGFGLTDEARQPKPALSVVRHWAGLSVADLREHWPDVSVIVCAYNEQERIGECLESLRGLDYPNFEVIVCDDGSTDATPQIARRFPFRVMSLPHMGLSAARNAGVVAARANIVAFLDADACCHPDWLYRLVLSLDEETVAATGGPNLPVPGAGLVERAVHASPGAPVHVLVGDDRAEHVPGCNMAFRKPALEAVGGFDVVYTTAGDDVDVCWKLLDRGHEIAFAPAAQVRHHRRDTVRGYLRQQRGYGRAERMVARRHPHRFNRLGQARWRGFIYRARGLPALLRPVVYHGPMGLAPYQAIVRRRMEPALDVVGALVPLGLPVALLGAVLFWWSSRWLALPLLAGLAVGGYAVAVAVAVKPERGEARPTAFRLLAAVLHVLQPMVRTWGRLSAAPGDSHKSPSQMAREWDGDRAAWLAAIERGLFTAGCTVRTARPHQSWDLWVSTGPLLMCRLTVAVAWHWLPRSRMALRPRPLSPILLGMAAIMAGFDPVGWALFAGLGLGLSVETVALSRRVSSVVEATSGGAR